jgi:hypothetical protein
VRTILASRMRESLCISTTEKEFKQPQSWDDSAGSTCNLPTSLTISVPNQISCIKCSYSCTTHPPLSGW